MSTSVPVGGADEPTPTNANDPTISGRGASGGSQPSTKPGPGKGTSRRKRVIAVAAAVVVLAALGWLFAGEGEKPAPPKNLADLSKVDGTLSKVDPDRLVMKPFTPLDGKDSITFEVPEKYRKNFDLAHLRSHSSVGIPTRIYYLEQDGRLIAVYKADAPANSSTKSTP